MDKNVFLLIIFNLITIFRFDITNRNAFNIT